MESKNMVKRLEELYSGEYQRARLKQKRHGKVRNENE